MSAIAKIYASLIIKGNKTIDEVPESIKEEVVELVAEEAEKNN